MTQHLWMLNSALLGVCLMALALFQVTHLDLPPMPRAAQQASAGSLSAALLPEAQTPPTTSTSDWELIYQNDIFGTYVPQEIKQVKKNLITPVPEPLPVTSPITPEIRKQTFIAPLTLTLRGVILAGDEDKSVAFFADEANKEAMYYVGDSIKDAQIIKIAQNRVVLMRSNGQQDVYYLRKDDALASMPDTVRWQTIVKKIDETTMQVDPEPFCREVESLGALLEGLAVIGVVFEDEKPIGVRLGTQEDDLLSKSLGLASGDVIVKVNDIDIAQTDGRLKAYESVVASTIGASVRVQLLRGGKPLTLTYQLAHIPQPKKYDSTQPAAGKDPADQLKMNKQQEHEQMQRRFAASHQTPAHHEKTMMDIRRRIFENLQARLSGQAPPS